MFNSEFWRYAHTLKSIQYNVWNDNKKFCAISAIVNGKDELETGLEAKMTLISINLLFIHSF